jgi:hypothetical protein
MQFAQERGAQLHFAVAGRSVLYRDLPAAMIAHLSGDPNSDLIIESLLQFSCSGVQSPWRATSPCRAFAGWGEGRAPHGSLSATIGDGDSVCPWPTPESAQHPDGWVTAGRRVANPGCGQRGYLTPHLKRARYLAFTNRDFAGSLGFAFCICISISVSVTPSY